jgi:hypothetical protein
MSHRHARRTSKDYILISWTRPFLVAVELQEEGSYASGANEGATGDDYRSSSGHGGRRPGLR